MIEEEPQPELTVVFDANMLIHGKALVNLPWHELGRSRIDFVYVAPVMREIDQLKTQSGRPNKQARKISADFRQLRGQAPRICQLPDGTVMSLRTVTRPVDVRHHDRLDLSHADQNLINHCLALKAEGHDIMLVTDDTICAATADEVGLPVFLVTDDWLREPEPDERDRENARLKEQLRLLTLTEPRIEGEFQSQDAAKLISLEADIEQWPALTDEEVAELMEQVATGCPPATNFERPETAVTRLATAVEAARLSPFGKRTVYTPATEQEIERYRSTEYPEWLARIQADLKQVQKRFEAYRTWPSFRLSVTNTGTRPAADVLLKVTAQGSFHIANLHPADEENARRSANKALSLPLPPAPPRGTRRVHDPLQMASIAHRDPEIFAPLALARHFPKPRDEDAFYWRSGRDGPVDEISLECKSWRHGEHAQEFEIAVQADTATDIAGAIILEVHASNLSVAATAKLPVRLRPKAASTFERAKALIDKLVREARRSQRL